MLPTPARMFVFFFFNDTATTEIYTLSLHDALPISSRDEHLPLHQFPRRAQQGGTVHRDLGSLHRSALLRTARKRSEEHTSELQSPCNLVCRLLLEKKKNSNSTQHPTAPVRCSLHLP